MAHRQKHRDAAARARRGFVADTVVLDEPAEAVASRTATEAPEVSAYAEAILLGLQRKPLYQGPVDHRYRGTRISEEVIAHRRVRGRIAKQSRKANRCGRRRS